MTDRRTSTAIAWLPRTIAVLLLMLLPAVLGNWLDDLLETKFLALAGLILGMVLGTTMLLILAKRLIPPAGGKPIPFEDEEVDEEESSQDVRA